MTSTSTKSDGTRRRAPAPPPQGATAVLIATAASAGGEPSAALAWAGGTVLGRLLDQLAGLGVTSAHVIARAEGAAALEPLLDSAPIDARLDVPDRPSTTLRTLAALARDGGGPLVIAYADVVTQREALAALLLNPRVATGILSTTGRVARPFGYRARVLRGRVVAAASAYHRVGSPNATFLGVLKVAAADRARLAAVAEELAALLEAEMPPAWEEELEVKDRRWQRALVRGAIRRAGGTPPEGDELDVDTLTSDDLAELERRLAFAREDVVSLLLVGLVRSDVHVGVSGLRRLFWARPTSPERVEVAEERIANHDEERALLDSAVKQSDGFFTTFFVSPYSKYMARWAARRGLTPNQVTLISAGVGALAALAFANGGRTGLVAGALLLQLAFTLDCVDGQLARYTRSFSSLGAWLDSIFDRGKEYLVYAGLAIGASRAGDPVWLLAGSALALQTTRHAIDFSYPMFQHQLIGTRQQPPIEHPGDRLGEPSPSADHETEDAAIEPPPLQPVGRRERISSMWRAGDSSSTIVWVKKIIAFPIGERFAAISISAALFWPKVTFIVLLSWGGFAIAYVLVGRSLRSMRVASAPAGASASRPNSLDAFRDDGPVASTIGGAVGRWVRVPAIMPLLVALAPMAAAIVVKGDAASHGLVVGAVAWAVVAGGLASARPLTDRLRWAVPPALRVIEYAGLLWIAAVAGPSSLPAAFALLCGIAYHHYDTVYGSRHRGVSLPRWVEAAGGGWDGRLLAACVLLLAGALPAGFYVMAVALCCLFVGASIHGWRHVGRIPQPAYDDEEDEDD